jgi:HD-GYP domain-containing protein (c-di-GMP phosphodiesterase class II)
MQQMVNAPAFMQVAHGFSRHTAQGFDESSLRPYRRIAVASARIGMFVAELDRPWLDTPFGLQGFLISNQRQIEALREFCQYVIVDVTRSDMKMADAILHVGIPVTDASVPNDGGDEFRCQIGRAAPSTHTELPVSVGKGLFRWAASLVGRGGSPGAPVAAPVIPRELETEVRATLAPGEALRPWAETHPVERELPRARAAFQHSEKVLADVFNDLANGRLPEIEPVRGSVDQVVASMLNNPDALLWVANLRQHSARSYQHALKVSLYLVVLGRQLGYPRDHLVQLGTVGLLADIGNARIPALLLEKPGMLTPEEFAVVKTHVRHTQEMLSDTQGLPVEVLMGVAQHHERMDGSGYPKGLAGRQISVYGRMVAIVDCFAALTSDRPYARAQTPHEALMSLFQWSPGLFHAPLVEQFVQGIGLFPVGSLVELSSGEVAVVLAHNRLRRLEPRVLVLTDAAKQPLERAVERDLHDSTPDGTPRVHILKGLPPGAYGVSPQEYYGNVGVES